MVGKIEQYKDSVNLVLREIRCSYIRSNTFVCNMGRRAVDYGRVFSVSFFRCNWADVCL